MVVLLVVLVVVNKLNFLFNFMEVLYVYVKDLIYCLIKGFLVMYKSGKYCDVILKIGEM